MILHKQVDLSAPTWYSKKVSRSLLSDETDFMQLGQQANTEFITAVNDLTPNSSSWNFFPSAENPKAEYKYVSVHFESDKNLRLINRSTYSFLYWLGDVGGLNDALVLIVRASSLGAHLDIFSASKASLDNFQVPRERKVDEERDLCKEKQFPQQDV